MAITLPNSYTEYVPLDTLLASQLNSDNANNAYMADNFPVTSYSTSEVETEAKWIDGKTIYKKTINFGTLPNSSAKVVAHGISNLAKIIRIEQHIDNGSSNSKGFLQLASTPTSITGFNLYGTNTSVVIETNSDRSSVTAYITLYYTKTS